MLTLQSEPLFMVLDEVQPLLEQHYEELCRDKDRVLLAPMWEKYAALEAAGCFVVYTARDEGELIGYAAFFIQPSLHHADLTVVLNDLVFIHPDHRGSAGPRMIKFAEKQIAELKHAGTALQIVWSAKPGTLLESLLPKLGYQSEAVMFGKLL